MGVVRLGLPLCLTVALGAVLALMAIAQTADAGTQVIEGDWVVSGGLTALRDAVVDVHGHVTVLDGGVLSLDNCTLLLNATAYTNNYLRVASTGSLIAHNSTIRGARDYGHIVLSNDSLLEDCIISHLQGWGTSEIVCDGGHVRMTRTEISVAYSECIEVRANLTMVGCTVHTLSSQAIWVHNYGALWDVAVVIDRCRIENVFRYYDELYNGIFVRTYRGRHDVGVCIRDSTVSGYRDGLRIDGEAGLTVIVERCHLLGNVVGASINTTGARITLRGNLIGKGLGPYCLGLSLGGDRRYFTHQDNTVIDVWAGYSLIMFAGMSCVQEWSGLHTRHCEAGLNVHNWDTGSRYRVALSNSTFLESAGSDSCFNVGNGINLSIYDTEHPAKSGCTWGDSRIMAYTNVDITDVVWKDGPPIASGELHLEEHRRSPRAVLDISSLERTRILSWWADDEGAHGNSTVYPTIYDGLCSFQGGPIDLWSSQNLTVAVAIVDDYSPVTSIGAPVDKAAYRIGRLRATGAVLEEGSGLAAVLCRLDDVVRPGPVIHPVDWWELFLPELVDGRHVLEVWGVDLCGNVGILSCSTFEVDTRPPPLVVGPIPAYVPTESVTVRGTTEPGVALAVASVACLVEPNGSFAADVPLVEGQNKVLVVAVDRAGNENTSLAVIIRDTLVPILDVTTPGNGTWTNATVVTVTGHISLDASLVVNGAPVPFWTGRFSCELTLAEGAFEILAVAEDRAGNEARTVLMLNVDWAPPRLEVFSPDRDIVHTTAGYMEFFGEVHDRALGSFTVNGTRVGVFMDRFLTGFSVPEGLTSFVLRAEDLAGNSVTRTFAVHRDITLPNCMVELVPIGGEMRVAGGKRLVTTPTVEVRVAANEDVIVALGDLVKGPCRECVFHITLEAGPNALAVTVHDLAGNMVTPFSWLVTLDTIAPHLEVRSPHQGLLTSRDSVIVEGLTEPGAVLTIEGRVRAVDDQGFFRVEVPLRKGSNVIEVSVTDDAGHVNSTAVEVTREQGFGHIADDMGASTALVIGLVLVLLFLMLARHRYRVSRERDGPEEDGDRSLERRGGGGA